MFLVSSSKTTKSQNPHSVVVGIFSQEKLEHRVKHIQDVLGKVQDVRVLRKLLARELGGSSNLPDLELFVHRAREEDLAEWAALKYNYLDLGFRLRLHQMVIKPCWPALPARNIE
jgi:CHAD domain-containing protein